MTKLITRTRYFLRGVWVRQDALGQVYSWVFADDVTVRLALPRSATDFNNSEEAQRLEPHWAHVRASAVSETEFAHAVYLVQVDAEFEDPINARQAKAAYQAERSSSDNEIMADYRDQVEIAWHKGYEACEHAITAWLAHVRVTKIQPWLGTAAENAPQFGGSYLIDAEQNEVPIMSFGSQRSQTIRHQAAGRTLSLTVDDLDSIRDRVASSERPDVASTLMADARFLSAEAKIKDPQRAILSAASACEIKAKITMRDRVDDEQAEALEKRLKHTSNLRDLIERPAKIAFGKKLNDVQPELVPRIVRLNEVRDAIMHRGTTVGDGEAWQLVAAAGMLLEWLESA